MAPNNTAGDGVSSLWGVLAADAASLAPCSAADTDALVWIAQRPASTAAKKHRKKSGATKANSTVACAQCRVARCRKTIPSGASMVGREKAADGDAEGLRKDDEGEVLRLQRL